MSLKKNRQFRFLYGKGKSNANRLLVIYVMPNGLEYNRLGISISKKVGNSVTRSRVKRLIKESYRLMEHDLNPGWDLAVIARKASGEAAFRDIQPGLWDLLRKHGLIEKAP